MCDVGTCYVKQTPLVWLEPKWLRRHPPGHDPFAPDTPEEVEERREFWRTCVEAGEPETLESTVQEAVAVPTHLQDDLEDSSPQRTQSDDEELFGRAQSVPGPSATPVVPQSDDVIESDADAEDGPHARDPSSLRGAPSGDHAISDRSARDAHGDPAEGRIGDLQYTSEDPAPCRAELKSRNRRARDRWEQPGEGHWVRIHQRWRCARFTPAGVRGGPDPKRLDSRRVTFLTSGEVIRDSWRSGDGHRAHGRYWRGETHFWERTGMEPEGHGCSTASVGERCGGKARRTRRRKKAVASKGVDAGASAPQRKLHVNWVTKEPPLTSQALSVFLNESDGAVGAGGEGDGSGNGSEEKDFVSGDVLKALQKSRNALCVRPVAGGGVTLEDDGHVYYDVELNDEASPQQPEEVKRSGPKKSDAATLVEKSMHPVAAAPQLVAMVEDARCFRTSSHVSLLAGSKFLEELRAALNGGLQLPLSAKGNWNFERIPTHAYLVHRSSTIRTPPKWNDSAKEGAI